MHRFYTTDIDQDRAFLDETETKHLTSVLRIREGEAVRVFDGRGHEYLATVAKISKRSAVLTIQRNTQPASPESPLDLTLAVALTKGEKFEIVIQKAVELGVNTIVPVLTARCDVKPSEPMRRVERWRRIALDACKQSGRARLMEIGELKDFATMLRPGTLNTRLLFSERDGSPLSSITGSDSILAAVGPEGGWNDDEIDSARAAGFDIVTLGGRILRAETAAIATAAVLQNRFGDLN